jgi:ribosome-binding protein aMBF1 (putative translation factor)
VSIALPKPKSITADEVVLSRDDWERIVTAFGDRISTAEIAEDEEDAAAVAAARADDARFMDSIRGERGRAVETAVPIEVVKAKIDGAHPITAWRDHRGWTQLYLSFKSGVGLDLIAQFETRRKKGNVETLDRLARTLGIPIEALIEDDER